MTIKELKETISPGIDQSEIDLLFADLIDKPREFIITHPEYNLTARQAKKITQAVERRKSGEPVAYLTGHKEFYGLDFFVNPNVLIPRPETELIIEETMAEIQSSPENKDKRTAIIDVGTGSGCIIITLAKLLANAGLSFHATDISSKALFIAKKNAKLHGVEKKINFQKGNIIEPILKNNAKLLNNHYKLFILANLPYLTPEQVKNAPSIQTEPKTALLGGRDGLKYYRELFKSVYRLKKIRPELRMAIICEIDPAQKKAFSDIADKLSESKTVFKKDLCGKIRLAINKL